MHTISWAPGSKPKLDRLFNDLREQHYNDHSHRLWKNYSEKEFNFIQPVALTIYFDDNEIPEICSSISTRDCWPKGVYRIHNRVWKPNNKKTFLTRVSDSMGYSAKSQIRWLTRNTDCKLYFISRQTSKWEEWMIKHFEKDFNIHFKTDNFKYLTCPNECDDTCWQKIIYNGNSTLLNYWKHRNA